MPRHGGLLQVDHDDRHGGDGHLNRVFLQLDVLEVGCLDNIGMLKVIVIVYLLAGQYAPGGRLERGIV